jgi:hypothetical protein
MSGTDETKPDLPELEPGQFPLDAVTEAKRLRYRTSVGIARILFEGEGERAIWMAARSIYSNPNFRD